MGFNSTGYRLLIIAIKKRNIKGINRQIKYFARGIFLSLSSMYRSYKYSHKKIDSLLSQRIYLENLDKQIQEYNESTDSEQSMEVYSHTSF